MEFQVAVNCIHRSFRIDQIVSTTPDQPGKSYSRLVASHMRNEIWIRRDGLDFVIVQSVSRGGNDVRFWRFFDGPAAPKKLCRGRFEGIYRRAFPE